jgi:hypothetical protein
MASPEIQGYEFGHIRIDGHSYQNDVVIFPSRVQPNWWRKRGHSLAMGDLETVLKAKLRRLIVGRGHRGRMQVPDETRRGLELAGIEVQAARTREAVRLYDEARQGGDVVAALHLTC